MREALQHCMEHNILKSFLEKHSGEVLGMILEEWDDDMAMAVLREEIREDALEEGKLETARNLLAIGLSLEQIAKVTGLDIETIKSLSFE
jgi:predicted transposase/invertase (TIGR01784 family)